MHQRRIVLAQRGRRRGRQQPRDRAEPALFGQLVLHDGELLHDGGVLLLGPGADEVLVVIAKDGVEHATGISVVSQDERVCPEPTGPAEEICKQVPQAVRDRRSAAAAIVRQAVQVEHHRDDADLRSPVDAVSRGDPARLRFVALIDGGQWTFFGRRAGSLADASDLAASGLEASRLGGTALTSAFAASRLAAVAPAGVSRPLRLVIGGEREASALAGLSGGGSQDESGNQDQFAHVEVSLV